MSYDTAIITRTRDRPLLLRRAVQSVVEQTTRDYIHVIVNDGGDRAEVEDVLDRFRGRYGGRLLLIHNQAPIGMEAAANLGIRASSSTCIVIHDDDDSWHPRFLSRMREQLEHYRSIKRFAGVVCYTTVIHERIVGNNVIETARHPVVLTDGDLTLWRMCAGNVFSTNAFLYTREALDTIGLYREDLPVQGDWEFNLRFMQKYEIGLVREALSFYHLRVNDTGGERPYMNSVEAFQSEKHEFYTRYLRNELLRADIARGQLGVGYMVNVNPILLRLDRMSRRLLKIWGRVRAPLALFARRS